MKYLIIATLFSVSAFAGEKSLTTYLPKDSQNIRLESIHVENERTDRVIGQRQVCREENSLEDRRCEMENIYQTQKSLALRVVYEAHSEERYDEEFDRTVRTDRNSKIFYFPLNALNPADLAQVERFSFINNNHREIAQRNFELRVKAIHTTRQVVDSARSRFCLRSGDEGWTANDGCREYIVYKTVSDTVLELKVARK
jgi:hypothetical protein